MKLVKNDSLQSFSIFFKTEKPGESIVVPSSYITDQIETLHRRRIFKISNA